MTGLRTHLPAQTPPADVKSAAWSGFVTGIIVCAPIAFALGIMIAMAMINSN